MNQELILPKKSIHGVVEIHGSKSITNRALIISVLSNGKIILKNVFFSDDIQYMKKALKILGFQIESDYSNSQISIVGKSGKIKVINKNKTNVINLFLGNSGTAIRFLTGLISINVGNFILTGNKRLQERPIYDLVNALNFLGCDFEYICHKGFPPIKVKSKGLLGGFIDINTKLSSQYLSSLLLVSSYCKNDLYIKVKGNLVSKPYIDLTLKVMKDFGLSIFNQNYNQFMIPSGQIYRARNYFIEGDASNASYFFAMAAVSGGSIRVKPFNRESKQGDLIFVDLLKKMGCQIKKEKNYIQVSGLVKRSIDVDMNNNPDLVPTLAIVALFVKGETIIRNVAHIRIKESDRIRALVNELRKIGALVIENHNGLSIKPVKNYRSANILTYDDHRMAMAFSIAALRIKGITIIGSECVSKSFPDYFKLFKKLCYY